MTSHERLEARLRAYYATIPASLPREVAAATGAAIRLQPQGRARTRPLLLLAAAVILVAITVGVAVIGSNPEEVRPPASPSPSGEPPASTAPPGSPTASPVGLSPGVIALARRDIPIGAGLEVRAGQSVLIVAGPEDHGGVPSYFVQHFGDLEAGYRLDGNLGWLAVDTARSALVPREPACPAEPLDLARIAAIQPFERPPCFGRRDLTFGPVTASTLHHGGRTSARWLSSDGRPDVFTGLPYLLARGMTDLVDGEWATVTGHFDDPSSASCGNAGLVAFCREQFHVTAIAPADPPDTVLRGTWRATALPPIDGRTGHTLTWTGREVVVWGGVASSRAQTVFDAVAPADGAAYDPATDQWRRIPAAPIAGRANPIAAWTGREVVVFGGLDGATPAPLDGAAYDPERGSWRLLAPSPLTGRDPVGGWLGGRLVVVTSDSAAAWDPATNRWTSLPAAPVREGWRVAVVAAGHLVILAFGDGATPPVQWASFDGATSAWQDGDAPIDPSWAGTEFAGVGVLVVAPRTGLTFDPATATWSTGSTCERAGFGPAWTGRYLIGVGAAWDRGTGRCLDLPPSPAREAPFEDTNGREFPVGVWTGDAYVTWSGGTGADIVWVPKDGAIFRPEDSLTP